MVVECVVCFLSFESTRKHSVNFLVELHVVKIYLKYFLCHSCHFALVHSPNFSQFHVLSRSKRSRGEIFTEIFLFSMEFRLNFFHTESQWEAHDERKTRKLQLLFFFAAACFFPIPNIHSPRAHTQRRCEIFRRYFCWYFSSLEIISVLFSHTVDAAASDSIGRLTRTVCESTSKYVLRLCWSDCATLLTATLCSYLSTFFSFSDFLYFPPFLLFFHFSLPHSLNENMVFLAHRRTALVSVSPIHKNRSVCTLWMDIFIYLRSPLYKKSLMF